MIARWPRPLFYAVVVLVIVADQISKAWATAALRPLGSVTVVPGFFDLAYGRNPGIAFGMFPHQGLLVGAFIILLALVAIYYSRGLNWAGWEPNLVGGLLCGGALGNLVDRLRLGSVVDFFDFYIGPHHWPTFNVADSFICISVGWIVLRQFFGTAKR